MFSGISIFHGLVKTGPQALDRMKSKDTGQQTIVKTGV